MRLLYYSVRRDETTERIVRPYNLLLWRGEPHLIAFCEWRQDIRQFFLGRIRDWYVLENESSFVPDPAFDIDEYLGRGLDLQHGAEAVTVRCRFSPYQARWIRERTYHASKTIEEQADGSLILSLEVAGTEEVRRWLLGYGAEVEILEPPALRRAMADEAKKLQKIYADFAE
jgi:predicted DNA-binding transcriptional regulator YafY